MIYAPSMKPLIRLLALVVVSSAALLTSGCADGPGNGGTVVVCKPGDTAETCPNISAYYPIVTVLVDGKTSESVVTGTAVALSWTAKNGTADPNANDSITCTASGAWSGSRATSGTVSVTQNVAGAYTYVLTCKNSFGSGVAAATLNATGPNTNPPTSFPIVTVSVDGKSAETVPPNQTVKLTWSAVNGVDDTIPNDPINCQAFGAWSGVQTNSGSKDVKQTVVAAYVYTLQCTNSFGSNATSAVLNVANGTVDGCAPGDVKCQTYHGYIDCPSLVPGTVFKPLVTPAAALDPAPSSSGLCLPGCQVNNAENVINPVVTDPAVVSLPVGLLNGNVGLTVKDTQTTYPANTPVGFVVSIPSAPLLNLALLQGLKVTAIDNGVDSPDVGNAASPVVSLDLLTLLSQGPVKAAVYRPAEKFNAVRLDVGGIVNLLTNINVYAAGVCVPVAP